MILAINSSNPEQIELRLISKTASFSHFFESHRDLSEKLPLEITKFLKKQRISLENISKIGVFTGTPGFSRERTAVAIANALAFGLAIEVVALKIGAKNLTWANLSKSRGAQSAAPSYEKAPNITLSSNRFKKA
jgi:tRNA A37 threonylcarbamoyladenosine modification protein TsaB